MYLTLTCFLTTLNCVSGRSIVSRNSIYACRVIRNVQKDIVTCLCLCVGLQDAIVTSLYANHFCQGQSCVSLVTVFLLAKQQMCCRASVWILEHFSPACLAVNYHLNVVTWHEWRDAIGWGVMTSSCDKRVHAVNTGSQVVIILCCCTYRLYCQSLICTAMYIYSAQWLSLVDIVCKPTLPDEQLFKDVKIIYLYKECTC